MRARHVAAAASCAALMMGASERPADAYSYASAATTGCHERITTQALRTVREKLPTAPPVAPDENERALIDDLPFDVDPDMNDLASASFLIGVRDNDLKGRGPTELDQLAAVHGNPNNQREHCLRNIGDDEPDGSARALEACKAFMRERIADALDGLDEHGTPDPNRRADIEVTLGLRGRVTASLPRYWINLGRAIHTLQDSFSHTFRSPDRMRVRTVLNWIEYVEGHESEARDGPTHRNGLDKCDDLDDLRTRNIEVATQASVDLLVATLDPALSRDAKLAAVDATIARYLSYEAGCTEANGWCDAPERQYEVAAACGCSVVGLRSGGALAAGACVFGLAIIAARRRHRHRRRRRGTSAVLPVVVLACAGAPAIARAGTAGDDAPAPGVPTTGEVAAERKEEKHRSFFGVYAAGSGSVTNPGLSGQLGVRFRLSDRWTVGIDGEVNGWYGVQTKTLRAGAFNAYLTAILRYPLRFEAVNLRTTANAGASTMLIDLYGAPSGTTGIFLGLTPLGIEWKATGKLYVIFDALGIALPVPQLKGAPFAYPQYRTALGLEVAF